MSDFSFPIEGGIVPEIKQFPREKFLSPDISPMATDRGPVILLNPSTKISSDVKFLKNASPGSGPLILYLTSCMEVIFAAKLPVQLTPCQRSSHGSESDEKSQIVPEELSLHLQLAPFVVVYKYLKASY